MLNCPFCNAELRDADLTQGRCSLCYGVLSWEDTGPPSEAKPPSSQEPPSYQEILRTVVERGADWQSRAPTEAASSGGQPPSVAVPPTAALATFAASPPPSPRDTVAAPGMRTVQPRDLSPEQERQVTALWEGSAEQQSPLMTLKAEKGRSVSQTNLVIRSHFVQRVGRSAPDADYVLLDVIGEGGVGVVYAAQQRSIDRTVALKTLRGATWAEGGEQDKFLAEAVVTGELDHPNIVPIYDVGRDQKGALFYSMKRVQGTPWTKKIASNSITENLETLMRVADAVAFAHARGVVHRDLKPENVMLGDFGEVLVMDWGIALPTKSFSKSGTIGNSTGMGGTPAYMAPEMATGPLNAIGPAADVYLLGAILYEIVAGRPPHTGGDVMECLRAAARNVIVPTDASGELVEIALQAMATDPADRYASVQDFQAALRAYQSHSESLALTTRATEELHQARRNRDYQDFAHAVFAFQEAIALWEQNAEARRGLTQAQYEYAEQALANSDFDLGLSLLNPDNPDHDALRRRLETAQHERDARQQRLQAARRVTAGLLVLIFLIVVAALFEINRRRNDAIAAEEVAVSKSEELALTVRDLKDANLTISSQRDSLQTKNEQIEFEKNLALRAKKTAEDAKRDAEDARRVADGLREEEERQGYVVQIGLADQMIAENAFDTARMLLSVYAPPEAPPRKSRLRHWEWGRLMYVGSRDFATLEADPRVEAVAVSADAAHMIAGGLSGNARVWRLPPDLRGARPELRYTLKHGGPIHAVAFSHGGEYAATAGAGGIKIWDLRQEAPREPQQTLTGHQDDVLSVTFSRDDQRLLSASRDLTARLWNWQAGREIQALRGHIEPVYCAAFSYDESRIVTAGEDGAVMVWQVGSSEKPRRFSGHTGPVYAVAFAPPDDRGVERVASAGYDKNILVWNPDDHRPYDFAVLDVLARDEPLPERSAVFPELRHRTLSGHTAAVRSLHFSPDGRRLISAGHDNTVKVWDLNAAADSPNAVRTLRGHGGWVRSCDFWAEGSLIASGGYDGKVKLWDVRGYEEERVLAGHDDAVLAASFSPDGEQVATAGRDRVAKLWPARGGSPLTLDEGAEFLVLNGVFFPDGRMLATSSGDNTVRKWNCGTGGQEPFQGTSALRGVGRRGALAVTYDGRLLITGSDDPRVKIWDADTGELQAALTGHLGEVTALAASMGNRLLASGDERGLCIVWRREDNDRWRAVHRLQGHTPGHAITAIRFLPNGDLLTACDDNSVGRWDTATGEEHQDGILKHSDSVKSLDVTDDGRWALTVTAAGLVHRWSVGSARSQTLNSPERPAKAAALSADGVSAVIAFRDGSMQRLTWPDRETGAQSRPPQTQPWTPQGDPGKIWSMVFRPTTDELLTVGGNHARLWDVLTGRKNRTFSSNGVLTGIAYSPTGDRVATSSEDGTVKIWDVASSRVVLQLIDAHAGRSVNSVAFSPVESDERLLTTGDDGKVRLRNSVDGQLLAEFARHDGRVCSAVFSSDAAQVVSVGSDGAAWIWRPGERDRTAEPNAVQLEQQEDRRPLLCAAFAAAGVAPGVKAAVVTAGEDNVARLWTREGQIHAELRGHTAPVTSVAFSPDGRRVLTASEDNTAKLWDTDTGREVLSLKRHGQPLTSVAFSPDGRTALTASRDGVVILWPSLAWDEE